MKKSNPKVTVRTYAATALPHLESVLGKNTSAMERLVSRIVGDVKKKRSLFVFGSGHSALLTMEVFHRAGGPSFVVPICADYLLPTAGPSVVRLMERTPGGAVVMLERAQPQKGEMIWLVSQSGINPAIIEMGLEARRRKLHVVAFTSTVHSRGVASRHPSKKRLFEICDELVDLGGEVGDASVQFTKGVKGGPLSTLTAVFLAHSILTTACAELESSGVRCTYVSVNTPEGELRNRGLEKTARIRDPLLR